MCIIGHYNTIHYVVTCFYVHIFTLFCVYIEIAFRILIILCYNICVCNSHCISTDVSVKQTAYI